VVLGVALSAGSPCARAVDVTESAAASLREAFTEIGKEFERTHPPHRVQFNFGASGQLVQRILRGAPVDVLATADQESMNRAASRGVLLPDSRADFTANRLVLALSVSRPVAVAMLEDLTKPEVERIAIGNPDSVPAGRHARSALEKAGLWEKLQTTLINVQNVRQVLDYEARGEVDAGFVYATDQMTMPYRVKAALQVPTPERIRYPVAVVKGGARRNV
jgi:molybdate transport system substrate-binding protein